MKRLCIAFATLLSACGPSYGGQDVKTPDQLVDEQDQIEQADEKNKKARGVDDTNVSEETDAEKKREFDRKQVDLELKRATRSAESCPGVVAEEEKKEHPRGETRVSITFQEDGTVRQVAIPSPFDGTPIGDILALGASLSPAVIDVAIVQPSLEDVFLQLTRRPDAASFIRRSS